MRSIVTLAVVGAVASGAPAKADCNTHACLKRTCSTKTCQVRVREKRWRRLQRQLPSPTKAMLVRLRGCETRGIAFPANYLYDGAHDGAYQYDEPTWHEAGGTGSANQASPAEQDVRTARFFPSHRSRWACSA